MQSVHQNMAEFLRDAEESGLLDEIKAKQESHNHARRQELVAEMKKLPTESQTDLPKFAKDTAAAARRLEKAREELSRSLEEYNSLSIQAYGAQLQFNGRRIVIEEELKKLCPKEICAAHADLYYLDNAVREKISFSMRTLWSVFGARKEEVSNFEEVAKVRDEIKVAMARLVEMTFEATGPEAMRAEIAQICGRIQKRTFELGVDKHEFNTRHSAAARERSAADALTKKWTRRANELASMGA